MYKSLWTHFFSFQMQSNISKFSRLYIWYIVGEIKKKRKILCIVKYHFLILFFKKCSLVVQVSKWIFALNVNWLELLAWRHSRPISINLCKKDSEISQFGYSTSQVISSGTVVISIRIQIGIYYLERFDG